MANSGKLVLLKIEGDTPGQYDTIVNAKSNTFNVNHTVVDITTKATNGWGSILEGGGITTIDTSLSGVFENDAVNKKMRALGFAGGKFNGQIVTGNGDKFQGAFIITKMTVGGVFNEAETFDFTIQNSGEITFTPAP